MHYAIPVSLGALIAEINKLNEKEPDEYFFAEIQEQFPSTPGRTLREMLYTLEKAGKVTRRKVGRKFAWKETKIVLPDKSPMANNA